ncbi:MAG: hypothetical protein JNL33_16190 [Betaproteobacteria bacterium]|nr:hypothetical protein [Betaproteobacteria bacterium]
MHVCLDVDSTVNYAPDFFVALCRRFPDAVITAITSGIDESETQSYLDSIGLRYDRIIDSISPGYERQEDESPHEWKAEMVNRLRPDILFECVPQVVSLIHPSILVFLPWRESNRRWIALSHVEGGVADAT